MTGHRTTSENRPYAERLPAADLPGRALALGLVLAAVVCGATAAWHPWAPVLCAAAVAAVAVSWQRPLLAAVLVVAVVPAVSGLERGLAVPFLKTSEALLLLSVAVMVLRRPHYGQRFRTVDWALGAFALTGAAFGALHVLTGTSESSTFVRVGLQPTMLFMTWWTASRAVRHAADLRVVLRWMLAVSTVPAVLTILQFLDAPGVRRLLIDLTGGPLLALPGSPGVIRATGPFPIWHSLAAYLVPVIAVAVVLLLRRDGSVLPRTPLVAVVVVDVAALLLTVTITVIVWGAVAVLILAALQRRLLEAAALLTITTVVAAVVFSGPVTQRLEEQLAPRAGTSSAVPQTLEYRAQVWERDFLPLLGRAAPVGLGNELPRSVLFQNTENQYISLVLRGGLLLLLAGVIALVAATAAVARVTRRQDLTGAVAGAALGVALFLPVAAMIWPYLTNAGFPQAWLALGGAVVGAAARR